MGSGPLGGLPGIGSMLNTGMGNTMPTPTANPVSSIGDMMTGAVTGAMEQSPFIKAMNAMTGADAAQPTVPTPDVMSMPTPDVASMTTDRITAPQVGLPGQTDETDYTPMIQQIAQEEGIDPQWAIKVANTEGGTKGWQRSTVPNAKVGTETSYGPFQLLVGGGDTGLPEGLGNDFIRQTGLDPADPKNAPQAIRFAMQHAKKEGWQAWYGAKDNGIDRWAGIHRARGQTDEAIPASLRTSSDPMLKGTRPELVDRFQALQEAWGQPLALNSAFRDAAKNTSVGGAKNSQHMEGNAIDINARNMSKQERVALIRQASDLGFTGIGVYNNAIHIDLGGRRTWGPSYHKESVPAWAKDVVAYHMGNTKASTQMSAAKPQLDAMGNPVPKMQWNNMLKAAPQSTTPTSSPIERVLAAVGQSQSKGAPKIDMSSSQSSGPGGADYGAEDVAQSQQKFAQQRQQPTGAAQRKQALQQRLRYQA